MLDIKQASMLELALELLKNAEGPAKILDIIERTLELKGIADPDGEQAAQLYIDLTTSSDCVFVGEGNWDLKERNNLDVYDRDGSFYAVPGEGDEDDDENEIKASDYDYGDEDKDDSDNEYNDDEENEDEDEYNYNDNSFDKYDDPESADDDDDEENYLDEEKYNDIMDDYEDMYDEN